MFITQHLPPFSSLSIQTAKPRSVNIPRKARLLSHYPREELTHSGIFLFSPKPALPSPTSRACVLCSHEMNVTMQGEHTPFKGTEVT